MEVMTSSSKGKKVCFGCKMYLTEPYIKCVECSTSVWICLHCFAQGYEASSHKNNHDYEVISLDFSIIEDTWNAVEEIVLLDSIAEFGLGNWSDIACRVRTKSPEECERHYLSNYINNPKQSLQWISEFVPPDATNNFFMIPYQPCDDPPRPKDDPSQAVDMAQYMPCRGDFGIEYDNFAECDIKDIKFDFVDQSDDHLKLTAVEIYLSRIKERCFRKRLIKDYGLINIHKTDMIEQNLPKTEKDMRERLKPFCKLHTAEEHERLVQGLLLEYSLKQEILKLQHCRAEGLVLKEGAKIYQMSRDERLQHMKRDTMLQDITYMLEDKVACQSWLQKQAILQSSIGVAPFLTPSLGRKPASRLDISGTPGVERLTEEERELCSKLRLLPEPYLHYKHTLMKESVSLGSLKLAQARTLIKIDVNKTRKLYDFFVRKNWIKGCT
ncbi:transcriptional adapter 2-alpha-like [Xenia sp. Carnegie-2017]|uniref:transcriptional adapter 2-alpha-like n=1 Tax=Xenia sp. Carnegie-2017 TaxID=2897299 RepID=UPI001F040F07|nr:transcriptional adapter 2-alpha-like [Xenia sp. Carnegie-2017]